MSAKFAKHLIVTLFVLTLSGSASLLSAQNDLYDIHQIQEIKINFYQSDWRHILDSLFINFGEEGRLVCDVAVNGKDYPKAGIRFKGFSSYDVDRIKNPFNIDLDYTYKHQNYQGYTKLKLGNVTYDPSFVREAVSYKIAQKYMPASQANFAKIYINDVYAGLYVSVEAVDDKYISKFFESEGNCFIKGSPEALQYPFGQNSNLAYTHGADSSGYMPFYKLESKYYGWNDLFNFIYTLNNDTSRIPEVLNVDRALWMHAFNYALMNLDSYIGYSQNYYLYKDDNGLFNTIPWDFNMSFGSFRNTDGISLNLTIDKMGKLDPLEHLLYNSYTPRPLMKKLFVVPQYRKMYLAHLRTIVKENFENNAYFEMASEFQNIADSAVLNDTNKFYSYTEFKDNLTTDAGPASAKIPGLKSIVEARVAYLSTYSGFSGYPIISNVSSSPEVVRQNAPVWITAKVAGASAVQLNYRYSHKAIFSSIDMFDDGNHNDGIAGDSIFGVQILADGKTFQYYLWAENDSTGSFSPERAQYEFYSLQPLANPGDVVINEVKTSNSIPYATFSSGGWIELFNNTTEPIALKNAYLSNDSSNLYLWRLPDTLIASKSYLMIGMDNTFSTADMNTGFSLANQNGSLFLTYGNGDPVDALSYALMPSSLSLGRYPNGKGLFSTMSPTCAGYNSIPSSERATFSVFPNPTQGPLYFELDDLKTDLTLEIYNTLSQKVYSQTYSINEPTTVFCNSVNTDGLTAGVYYLKATWNDRNTTIKFIKQ
jgi:hypothetical protein